MKIGIDARILNNYVKFLLRNLVKKDKRNKYVLFFDSRVSHKQAEKFKSKNCEVKYFPFSRYKKFIGYGYSQILVSAFLAKERLDIFHAATGTMSLVYPGKTILNLKKIGKNRAGKILQKKICKKAKKILVNSASLKSRLEKNYKIKSDKIVISKKPKAADILKLYQKLK